MEGGLQPAQDFSPANKGELLVRFLNVSSLAAFAVFVALAVRAQDPDGTRAVRHRGGDFVGCGCIDSSLSSGYSRMAHRFKKPKRPGSRPSPVTLPGLNITSLYKYFSELKHAEAFLDGEMLFRTLAYFRDNEDVVRGDEYEGTSTFLPAGGLLVNNLTQGTTFTLPRAFESTVKTDEVFVYCVSQTLSAAIAKAFDAVACVEITKIATLCARIRRALPPTATFRARPVEYYPQTQGGNPRWALPDHIATSKLDRWASQNEYRFIFSFTQALGFEKVELRLVDRKGRPAAKPEEHIPIC